ncbi:MAG: GGDEF domain-containing protein [Oscillospiraceae bacterium]|nr:GGDEF domain-containing protein [Oscillospiraceae bacterium]
MKTNILLLGIHILLTIPYMLLSPRHMMAVNFFSILFYILGFALIRKSRRLITIYSFMILVEILLHDICCVLIFGWGCGFQLWIISLVSTYIKDYISPDRSVRERALYSNLFVATGFLIFVALYLVTRYVPLPFQDPPSAAVTTLFVIMNAFITFTAMGAFTGIYTRQMEYQYSELHRQADFDQLTGLGNRYYMNDLLAVEERHSDAVSGYSVAMIDIDDFKAVNDTYGHNNGDLVLRDIADLLSADLPDSFKAGRWGGEEFLVISDSSVSYAEFQRVLETLREKIASHVYLPENEQQIHCTVSIGAARYREGCSVQQVIKKADENLYAAKKAGKNRLAAEND